MEYLCFERDLVACMVVMAVVFVIELDTCVQLKASNNDVTDLEI